MCKVDANGSQTLKAGDGADHVYTWGLRNRMHTATVGRWLMTYGYDGDGERVSEQTGTTKTRYFRQDKYNPTGYPQTVEERVGTTASAATLDRS